MRIFILVLLLCIPGWTSASVRISEVTWMGTAVSSDDEWIELFNDGSSVSLEGWTISDGVNLSISLSGQLAAGSYAVLERTNDDSAPGSAFLIYSGAMPNSGGTLTLRNGSGSVVDTAAGGEGWVGIGGDNSTKETAQRSSSGWITAAATPGSGSLSVSATPNTNQAVNNTTQRSSNNIAVPVVRKEVPAEKIPHVLQVEIEAPLVAYVNQPVELSASPSGLGDTILNSLSYSWNFGDGEVGFGKEPTHTFSYPGKYIVFVDASFKKMRDFERREIEVRDVPISLNFTEGQLVIKNEAPYEVDISGYKVQGKEMYTFPSYSFLVAGGSLTLPFDKHKATVFDKVVLYDRAGNVIINLGQSETTVKNTIYNPTPAVASTAGVTKFKVDETPFSAKPPVPLPAEEVKVINKEVGESTSAASKASYFGLAGTIALGIITALTFGL